MKLLKPTYLLRTLLLLCAVAVVSSACERNETQSLSDKLDHMIANRQVYDCQKEQRIAELRHLLSVSCLTPAQEYEINDRLFGEFHKYKLDSAIRYMERNVLLARRLGDRRKGCLSGIRLAELYSSTGMSIEAKRMLDSIDRRSVPRDMLATYYKAYNRFYQQYVAFSGQRHFRELEERYQDSVIMFADTVSVRYKLDRLYQMSRRNQSHEMEVRLLGFLNSLEPDSQLYAECAYSVGSFYRRRGDDWLARKYYMLSAMTDIRNSTKENAAFQALATLYYRHDDLFRAFRYTQAAVEDALFSNVQFRTVQMSELYSIIIASHQAKESRTKHKLQYYLVLISVLSAVLVLLFIEDWRMGLSMLIVVPLGIGCFMSMFSGYEEKFQRTVTATKALNDTAVEYINGIEVIKAFSQSGTSYAKFVSAAKEGADCFIDWMRGSLFGQVAGMAIFPSTLLGILPVGCMLYMHGTLPAETFLSIIVLSFGVMQPLITAFSYTDDIVQVKTIIGEVAEVLSGEDMQRPESAEKLPADNAIQLKDVRFAYHDKEVLHGIDLHIAPGTVNALVGPSGSGKSTIARLIASLWDVKDGEIDLGGVDIRTLPLAECTKHIAYVSQDNYLFDLSVMDNIRMGRKGATDAEVIDAAKKCGCHEFIMGLENGYQTVCGASGGHLSGGERQRISIARAMLKDAPIVILDEATSYTDPENEAVIQSALGRLVRGKTLLVIAHRLSTIADADQIIVVNQGKIEATGTQAELLASCPLYQTMWEAHISVKDDGEVA